MKIQCADALSFLKSLPSDSVDCFTSSSPYMGLRSYKTDPFHWDEVTYSPLAGMPTITVDEWDGELGAEPTIELFIGHLVAIYREIRRVLKPSGVVWTNIGDSFVGTGDKGEWRDPKYPAGRNGQEKSVNKKSENLPNKNLMMIPARLALALQADGWWLRCDAIWHKENNMPSSQQDRFTLNHEYFFQFTKSQRYWFDLQAVAEPVTESTPGRMKRGGGDFSSDYASQQPNHGGESHRQPYLTRSKRTVMTVATAPSAYDFCRCGRDDQYVSHYAAFPPALIRPLVLSSCPEKCCAECGTPYQRIVEKRANRVLSAEIEADDGIDVDSAENAEFGLESRQNDVPSERPQRRRAEELFRQKGLTQAHLDAIAAVSMADTGKALITMDGAGKNRAEVQRLADEAKQALGGYYREFCYAGRKETLGWRKMCTCAADETVPGTLCDPFVGSGTSYLVALELNRKFVGADINPDYVALTNARADRWREDPQFRDDNATIGADDDVSEVLGSSKPVQLSLFEDV